ncbi:MAG: phenylpyruvate tautomerase MIF-related protein [Desulfovibrionales bacterium]
MPYLTITTNASVDEATEVCREASRQVCRILDKPEKFMMVSFQEETTMLFGGLDRPAAYLRLEALGLSADRTGELTESLCGLAERMLKVPRDRVYIVFSDIEPAMWGWNNRTFG